jgi:hypothetical protein
LIIESCGTARAGKVSILEFLNVGCQTEAPAFLLQTPSSDQRRTLRSQVAGVAAFERGNLQPEESRFGDGRELPD